jgi:hypothetical protein
MYIPFILFLSSTTFLPPKLLKFFLPRLSFNHSLSQDHCMLLCFFPSSFNLNLFLWFISLSFLNLFYLFLPLLLTFLSLVHFSLWFWPLKSPFQGAWFLTVFPPPFILFISLSIILFLQISIFILLYLPFLPLPHFLPPMLPLSPP